MQVLAPTAWLNIATRRPGPHSRGGSGRGRRCDGSFRPSKHSRGNLDRVRSLVEAGADVTARDERFGATALDWAGWTKQDAVVAYLKSVMKEADPQW